MTDRRRRLAAVLGGAVLAGALASCTGGPFGEPTVAMPSTSAAGAPSSVTAREAGRAEGMNPASEITCDPKTCTLTLRTADPRKVRAFGTSLSLARVQRRTASLTVGDATVECQAGQSVRAGALLLFCDEVTSDSVRLTAEVG